MYRRCSTPKNKITRNVLGSERELRIERFMTAAFASRPLGEVGGASRNRLLVDKMIVWRAILGLIMASKWPAPESQSACRFSNDRRHRLAINANKLLPRGALLRQESPPRFHKFGDVDGRCLRFLRPIFRGLLGGAVFTAATKESAVLCTLQIILWQLFLAVEILLLPSRWPRPLPSKPRWCPAPSRPLASLDSTEAIWIPFNGNS